MKPYKPDQKQISKYNPCKCGGCGPVKAGRHTAKKVVRRNAKEQIERELNDERSSS